jgi:hypothetical protein
MILGRAVGVVIVVLFYRMKKKITILNQASPHGADAMTKLRSSFGAFWGGIGDDF